MLELEVRAVEAERREREMKLDTRCMAAAVFPWC